jgi:hypothetical protein
MSHEVKLLVASWCPQSPSARFFWRRLKDRIGFAYEGIDVESSVGRTLVRQYSIRTVPRAILDDCVVVATQPELLRMARLLETAKQRSLESAGSPAVVAWKGTGKT